MNTLLPCFGNFFEEKISKTHQFTVKICLILQEKGLSLVDCIFHSIIVSISAAISMLSHFDGLLVNWLSWTEKYPSGFRLNRSNGLFIVLQLVNYPFLLIKETHARLATTTTYVLAYYVVSLIRAYHFFLTKTDWWVSTLLQLD